MKVKNVNLVYFSPNGTVKGIIKSIGNGTGLPVNEFDLTSFESRWENYRFDKNQLVIIALPVYGGRLPKIIREFFRNLGGDETPAAIVNVYGNRAYDDALVELEGLTKAKGFVPIAAAAFTAQHALRKTLAAGRPNEEDLKICENFGADIVKKLSRLENIQSVLNLEIPGNRPYKATGIDIPVAPETNDDCDNCGTCAKICPVKAINPENEKQTDVFRCLLCGACINKCPKKAKELKIEKLVVGLAMIEALNLEVKKAEIFM